MKKAISITNKRTCLAVGALPICPFVPFSKVINQLTRIYWNSTYLLDKRPHCGQCHPLLKTNAVVMSSSTSVGGGGGRSFGKSAARAGIDFNSRKLGWYSNVSLRDSPCFNVKKAVHSGFRHIHPCWYTCGVSNLQCSHLTYIRPVVNVLHWKMCLVSSWSHMTRVRTLSYEEQQRGFWLDAVIFVWAANTNTTGDLPGHCLDMNGRTEDPPHPRLSDTTVVLFPRCILVMALSPGNGDECEILR